MGRKEIGLWTAAAFLWALLAVLWTVGQGMTRSLREETELRALENRMASMAGETMEKQLKIAKWYNLQLEQGKYVPEWDYESILNLGEGRMGLLTVPELELSLPISHGIGGEAGHDPGTALPLGGREEQTVLYIDRAVLWRGGMAVYTALPGCTLCWQVESIQVMPRDWPADHPSGSALLTLVWDRGGRRTIVRCRPSQESPRQTDVRMENALLWGISPLFLIPVLCGLGKILYFIHPGRRKKGFPWRKLWKIPEKTPISVFAKI